MKNQLNMMTPIGSTGYGVAGLNIYKALRKIKDLDICIFPMSGSITLENPNDKQNLIEDIERQSSFSTSAPFFKIWHQFDLATRVGKGTYGALTFFEIDKLKPVEIQMLKNVDIIFVASKWAKKIIENHNIGTKIIVSPLGVDRDIFNELNAIQRPETEKHKYVFLNIGKWEVRKGHDILVEIFNDAFSEKDDVELWMVNHNPFLTDEDNLKWVNLYKNSKLGDKIKIYPRLSQHLDVAKIISLSDCGIFPARAEGWNHEALEFMSMNKPVILTNYSAHEEYATKDNAYLIEIDNLTPAIDNKFFDGFGNWADLGSNQYDQLVDVMRLVYNNRVTSNAGGLETSKSLSWTNTASIIHNSLFG